MDNIKNEIINKIREGVAKLEYKDDSVEFENVCPRIIEEALGDFDDGYELNGYDCDYWASIGDLDIQGCMRYGNATISKKTGKIRRKRKKDVEENVYTRTKCTLRDGYTIKNIPVAEKIQHTDHQSMIEDGLEPFYITFIYTGSSNQYVVIYAMDDNDARKRAFSIWDRRWDCIYNQEAWDRKREYYKERFEKEFIEREGPYALCY